MERRNKGVLREKEESQMSREFKVNFSILAAIALLVFGYISNWSGWVLLIIGILALNSIGPFVLLLNDTDETLERKEGNGKDK